MRISDWSSDVCSSDLVLVRHRLDDLFDGTPAERWLNLMRPLVPRAPRQLAAQSRGARLRLALPDLGPIFVKFGPILSTRRDLVPIGIETCRERVCQYVSISVSELSIKKTNKKK